MYNDDKADLYNDDNDVYKDDNDEVNNDTDEMYKDDNDEKIMRRFCPSCTDVSLV